jgi:hypothetical protein
MAPRAYWKGYLKLSLVSCPVSLYPATSERDAIRFHQINKKTGHRIKYLKVDADTGDDVAPEDIVKGYEVGKGEYLQLDPKELEAVALESTHVIEIDQFVPKTEIDELYLSTPYCIVPNGKVGQRAFADPSSEKHRTQANGGGGRSKAMAHERDTDVPRGRSTSVLAFSLPCGLEQEPSAPLGLVDPDFQQACGGNIVVLLAKAMRLAHVCRELLVVVTQFGEHIHWRDKIRIVVRDALQAADVADRAQGRTADLANAFGDRISGGEDLVALFV